MSTPAIVATAVRPSLSNVMSAVSSALWALSHEAVGDHDAGRGTPAAFHADDAGAAPAATLRAASESWVRGEDIGPLGSRMVPPGL
ncbi:MAG: hypothetical protein U0869_02130 [Chloroflexota bacterium]